MKHTDEQIIATVRKILDALHDPDTGFHAFVKGLKEQGFVEKAEQEPFVEDKEYELAAKYGLTRANNRDEIKFRLSGKDVMDSRLYVSCGQAAKAFCYVNSQLPKEEQLDLKVLFSTDIEHLIDAKEGHTLPCVQLSDGKWHAIEPQIQPKKDKQPGFEFVCDDVKVGGEIWHQLKSIKEKGRPYVITKIVTPEEHETTYSDFGKFIEASMVHKGQLKFVCSTLKLILQNHESGESKSNNRNIYEICKALNGKNSVVKVWAFAKGEQIVCRIGIEQDGAFYELNPTKQYLSFHKCENMEELKQTIGRSGFEFMQTLTPEEYVKEFDKRVQTMVNANSNERE